MMAWMGFAKIRVWSIVGDGLSYGIYFVFGFD